MKGSFAYGGGGRFELVGSIGEGGMGLVYEVIDRQSGAHVALKTLRHLGGDAILRLKREFRSLADLDHPNLVGLHELFEEGGSWFFTMELVRGVDFLAYVRPGGPARGSASPDGPTQVAPALAPVLAPRPSATQLDLRRLRAALVQLATGLRALHLAGKVHRDVKPSNIRVDGDGRLVLLDFGLVTELQVAGVAESGIVGTPAYMAPEQAASRPVGPEADWYAMGVVLYEALTGRLPYLGTTLEVMMNKQRFAPAPPIQLGDVPEDLNALCMDLLRFEPAARPPGPDVLRQLGVDEEATATSSHGSSGLTQTLPLLGREDELSQLAAAYADARRRGPVTLLIIGESGIGKSTLVRHFIDGLGDVVPLASRCYEAENVPFKAVDGVVDALARYLARFPDGETSALLPLHAALLSQVFPVLRRVRAFAQAPAAPLAGPDANELRNRVFDALRELFCRLCQRRSVVVAIDDLHWGDADGLRLLRALLRPPDAPPMFLIATRRPIGEEPALPGDVRRLMLAPLGPDGARDLARHLLERTRASGVEAETIARESKGHPLFIDELVRHVHDGGSDAPKIQLDDALRARIGRLEPNARRLLEQVAVAGAPLPLAVVAGAAGLAPALHRRTLAVLRVGNLVRPTVAREGIEHFHDRVREVVIGLLSAADLRARHRELAIALEASERADAEALCSHWAAAGEPAAAIVHAIRGAEAADASLAFDRAAGLYARAIALAPDDAPEDRRRGLEERRGVALGNAGRGAEAAAAFLAAAEGAPAGERIDLRRRAAQELIRAGQLEEGSELLRDVLRAFGAPLARSNAAAIASLVWRRTLVRLRGLGWTSRDESQIAREELARIDLGYAISTGLGMIDQLRAADFAARHLVLTLRAGEPMRVQRALAAEGAFRSLAGIRAAAGCERILAEMDAIAKRIEVPLAAGLAVGIRGIVSFNTGRFRASLEHCEQAASIFRDCPGCAWELGVANMFVFFALALLGDLAQIVQRLPRLLDDAEARGDLYTIVNLRTSVGYLPYLVSGDARAGHADVDEALERWPMRSFQVPSFNAHLSHVYLDILRGDGQAALERMRSVKALVAAGGFLRVQTLRVSDLSARLRAHLLEHERTGNALHLRAAARVARATGGERVGYATGLALLGLATIAHRKLDDERAVTLLRQAAAAFEDTGYGLYVTAANGRLGRLLGGSEGQRLAAAADAHVHAQGFRDVSGFYRLYAPGFDAPVR